MARSDNLYSVDTSDEESFSDELSPSDGYFTRNPMPMVQDPTMDSKQPEDKTLISPPHLQGNTGGSSQLTRSNHPFLPHPLHTASPNLGNNSSTLSSSYIDASPFILPRMDQTRPPRASTLNGPPPAYSREAEVSPSPTASEIRIQRILPAQHLERGNPPAPEPENMGRPEEEPTEETPFLSQQTYTPSKRLPFSSNARRKLSCRKIIRYLLLAALVFAVVTSLLGIVFGGYRDTVSVSSSFERNCRAYSRHLFISFVES